MNTKNIFHITHKNIRGMFGVTLLGTLALTGCVAEPGGGVAFIPPPVIVEAPPPVYVAPEPVFVAPEPVLVGPEIIVPIGGGGRYRR
jgi:hypothetical protein